MMRRDNLKNLVSAEMMDWKRSRGRLPEKVTEEIMKWHGGFTLDLTERLRTTKEKEVWMNMITYAVGHGTV